MVPTTHTITAAECNERMFDLLRGVAAYTGSGLIAALAKTVARYPAAPLDNAFNHKQIACKLWARDALLDALGVRHERIWVLGGWCGVLPAILFDDPRFKIGEIVSFDLDEKASEIARALNAEAVRDGRFKAVTADMYDLDYATRDAPPSLVINTSCEHIADVRGWLDRLPAGLAVLLQSNDYASEPEHVSCVDGVEAFVAQTALRTIAFSGSLPMKKYTRFMLIGSR